MPVAGCTNERYMEFIVWPVYLNDHDWPPSVLRWPPMSLLPANTLLASAHVSDHPEVLSRPLLWYVSPLGVSCPAAFRSPGWTYSAFHRPPPSVVPWAKPMSVNTTRLAS